MRGVQPNLRASSSYVEPERMCGLHRRAGAARRILVLVTSRRFPPPRTVEESDACFVVTDSTGQKLAYVYFEDEPGRRSAAKLITRDEARRNCQQYRQTGVIAAMKSRCSQRDALALV
jgi:hypothetical protein